MSHGVKKAENIHTRSRKAKKGTDVRNRKKKRGRHLDVKREQGGTDNDRAQVGKGIFRMIKKEKVKKSM